MTLTLIVLIVGFLLGSLALVTLPEKPPRWKLIAVLALSIVFVVEGGFLYWHYHGNPFSTAKPWKHILLEDLYNSDFKTAALEGAPLTVTIKPVSPKDGSNNDQY